MHSYALATTPEVDRRLLQGLGDVLADDRQITEGRNDFGQIVAGRTEETIPVPETLVTALSQTLESRIMGGGSRHPIQIQTVERISLDVLQRLEGAGTRLVPDEDRGHTLLQFLHLQHLLRLARGWHTRPSSASRWRAVQAQWLPRGEVRHGSRVPTGTAHRGGSGARSARGADRRSF